MTIENIQDILTQIVILFGGGSGIVAIMKKQFKSYFEFLKNYKEEFDTIKSGLLGLTGQTLMSECREFIKIGYCETEQKKQVEKLYMGYSSLGGNGVIAKLYEEFLDLPFEPPA
ncbi:MAG: hypothetical protein LBL93_07230 [Ruminococcus sp.]|jgi:wobble nucleotide-excising tRNase|nr:hypothetical protein [Ruminococcus sp.]